MKAVPVLRCRNMQESLAFYQGILGFALEDPADAHGAPVVNLTREGATLQLSILSGDGVFGTAVNILVDEVDELFETFVARGLDPSRKKESPVHQGPVDQTWGRREFYVEDPSGNTLRFTAPAT